MVGAFKRLWPLAVLAALPLLLTGCGSKSDPNAATQFEPVDEDEVPARSSADTKRSKPSSERPDVQLPPERPTAKGQESGKPSSKKAASGTTASKAGTERPPAAKGATAGSKDPALAGPTGDKVRLVRTLLNSLQREPPGDTQQEKVQNLLEQLEQTTVTADEILAEERAPPEAHDEALLAKFKVASNMLRFNLVKNAKEMFKRAAADLAEATSAQYATLGRVVLFKLHALEILQLQPRDAEEVLTALDTLLEAGGDVDLIQTELIPLAGDLERAGYPKEGVAMLTKMGDHFAASKDPREALVGKHLQLSALDGQLRRGDGDPKELGDQIVAKAKEVLTETGSGPGALQLVHMLARGQEGESPELAGRLYDLLEETSAASSNRDQAEIGKRLVDNGRKRLSLVGKPLVVTGVLIGNDPFDWKEYESKVVLVHFWALSNQASQVDLSNIFRLQQKYHDRGLEIIGINLDEDTEQLEEMFKTQKLPWPTLTSAKKSQRGFNHAIAKECGVIPEALPFNVLIGADGKVVAEGMQGPLLDETIVKLLPEEETPKTKPKGDDAAKEDEPAKEEESPTKKNSNKTPPPKSKPKVEPPQDEK